MKYILFFGPTHQGISQQQRRHDIEELVLAAAEHVEDGAVVRVRHGVQAVVGESVRDDPPLFGQRFVPETVDWCSVFDAEC